MSAAAGGIVYDLGTPNPRQVEFFNARAHHICYGGARGGGKSWAMRHKLCMLALAYPGINILLMRRTLKELTENHIIPLQRELNGIAVYRVTDYEFRFPTGSRIKLGYCAAEADVFQYQGAAYDIIGLEEATHFTETQYQFLTSSNRPSNPNSPVKYPRRMYYTCNPGNVGHAWVKRLFIDRNYRNAEKPEDYVFIPAKVWDNKVLLDADPEYVTQLQNLPPELRRAHLDGDWDLFVGQYFTEWDSSVHVIEPFAIPDHWLRFRAIDFGLDRVACLWGASDEEGNLYIYREYCASNRIVSQAAQDILERSDGRELCTFGPKDLASRSNDTGVPRTETFARSGLPLVIVSNGRVAGWENMHEWLRPFPDGRPPRLRIFNTCKELIECLPLLLHDEKNPDDVATEPHHLTHAPDALRYLLDGRPSITQAIPKPKAPWDIPDEREQDIAFFDYAG